MTPLEVARDYTCRGWSTVPVAYRGRNPVAGKKWQQLRLSEDYLQDYFNCKQSYNGVLPGDPSRLPDIDLDCPETRHMASHYLPKGDAIFGRKSGPLKHQERKQPANRVGRVLRVPVVAMERRLNEAGGHPQATAVGGLQDRAP